jgi:serine/threonine protein kinase
MCLLNAQEYESCVAPLSGILTSAREEMDEESIKWTTAVLFHIIVAESVRVSLRVDTLICCLNMMSAALVIRAPFMRDHLVRLHFLRYLVSCCELEEHIDAEVQPPVAVPQPVAVCGNLKKSLTYLDIPRLSLGGGLPELNLENPKLHLAFQPTAAPRAVSYALTLRDYQNLRGKYMVYASDTIHAQFLILFFGLLIDPRLHRLDTEFCDPFPHVNRKPNVLFTLMKHMEAESNRSIAFVLDELLRNSPADQDSHRLLRLLVPALFGPEKYAGGQHVASGAYGAVLAVEREGLVCAVKTLEKSRRASDNAHLVAVYTEVSILDQCVNDRRVTQLLDYGCTKDSYYIVMEFYPATLKGWRKRFGGEGPPKQTLLRVYREVLQCCTMLKDKKVNHFDIKCDNVMLDSAGYPALADFGESMSYDNEQDCFTSLNKGTEWIKSPEMLSIALNSSKTRPDYDRRQQVGAGPASDVWSIGCLFFELVTGEFLFADPDWSRFFLRITSKNVPLLTEENKAALNDENCVRFLEFVLQRSVRHRPDLAEVIARFDELFPEAVHAPLPRLSIPTFRNSDSAQVSEDSARCGMDLLVDE